MRVFFDTEFTGLHQETTLISIGCIAENGNTFYAELVDYARSQCDDWIEDNVLSNLRWPNATNNVRNEMRNIDVLHSECHGDKERVSCWLEEWLRDLLPVGELIEPRCKIEMWSDCLAYDWVLFCNLWGHAFKIPECVYYIPFDICTIMKIKGIDPDISREKFAQITASTYGIIQKHNALWDAKVIRACYDQLTATP